MLTINQRNWKSIEELSVFLNCKYEKLNRAYRGGNFENFLKRNYYSERLKFEPLSPDVIHVVADIWQCKCPVCGRTLITSTDELSVFVHNDEFCISHEVYDD